ncbi:hypothetical protein ACWIGM_08735 [Bosea sp. NPDC055332]
MLALTVAATLAVLAPLAWLLVETSRRRWLFVAVPFLVALPLAFYAYGSSLLGYAVASAPVGEFDVVHASVDEARGMVLLLIATPDGARLHAVPATEEARKQAGSAQAALEKGLPVRGRSGTGADQNEGELVFYVLPPMAQPKE